MVMNMKKVLVTGGTVFVSRYVAECTVLLQVEISAEPRMRGNAGEYHLDEHEHHDMVHDGQPACRHDRCTSRDWRTCMGQLQGTGQNPFPLSLLPDGTVLGKSAVS